MNEQEFLEYLELTKINQIWGTDYQTRAEYHAFLERFVKEYVKTKAGQELETDELIERVK